MKKAQAEVQPPPLESEPDIPRELSLGEALDELDRIARNVLIQIGREQARWSTEHDYHTPLSAIETAIADMLIPLAERR